MTSEDDLNKRRAEIDKRARKLYRRTNIFVVIIVVIIVIAIFAAVGWIIQQAQRETQALVDMGCEIHTFNLYGMAETYSCPGDPGYNGP